MIETKVKASAVAAFVVGALIAALNAVQDNPSLLGTLPGWAQTLIIALVPPLLTFLAGYAAPHTRR